MARKIEEVELDIAEVKELLVSAHRPSNQQLLAKHLSSLKTELQSLQPVKTEPKKVILTEEKKPEKNVTFTPLTKYSWDQEGSKVKVYFLLDGIGNEVTADKIDVQFEKQAVEVKIYGYKKINYIFAIKKLAGPIDKDTSKYLLKKNSLALVLIKKDSKHWSELNYKEEKFKKEEEKEKEEKSDPQASIMNMMKKMYDEGDDNMKRTIAEAWTKSQDKKNNPMGDTGGMPDLGGMGDLGNMGGMGGLGGGMPSFKPLGKDFPK